MFQGNIFLVNVFLKKNICNKILPLKKRMLPFKDFSPKNKFGTQCNWQKENFKFDIESIDI
jgi:hypothetical protein